MNFPSAPAHSFLEHPLRRKPADRDAGLIRPRRRPAPGEPHDVIWSESTGQLIDVATNAATRGESPARTDPDPPSAPARRILVVDDDAGIRNILTELLRRIGYRVTAAADGEAGWNALCAEVFDMMITDHAMPRLNGLDLLRRLRAGAHPIPVIFISGVMPWHEPDLARLLTPGATLEKPFVMTDLLARVHRFLDPLPDPGTQRENNRTHSADRSALPGVSRIAG